MFGTAFVTVSRFFCLAFDILSADSPVLIRDWKYVMKITFSTVKTNFLTFILLPYTYLS